MELSFRGSVNRWECDENDHLNVRFFVYKHWQTLVAGLASMGQLQTPDGEELLDRISVQHLRFLNEARISAPISGYWGVLKNTSSDKGRSKIVTELRNSFSGEPLCTCIHSIERLNLAGEAEPADYAQPRGITDADIEHAILNMHEVGEYGFRNIGMGMVQKDEVALNQRAFMHTYMSRLSDAMPHLWGALNAARQDNTDNEGGAVLEYRLRYHRPLKLGDCYTINSGIAGVGGKLQHFTHLIHSVDDQEVCVSASTVGVRMDLNARKAITLPEQLLQQMRELQIRPLDSETK